MSPLCCHVLCRHTHAVVCCCLLCHSTLLPVVPQYTAAIMLPSHVMLCCVAIEYRIAAVFAAYRAVMALLLLASPSCHCGMEGGQHWSLSLLNHHLLPCHAMAQFIILR